MRMAEKDSLLKSELCIMFFSLLKHIKAINKYRRIKHQCSGRETRTAVLLNNDARLRAKRPHTLATYALTFLWHDDTPVKWFSESALISCGLTVPRECLVSQSICGALFVAGQLRQPLLGSSLFTYAVHISEQVWPINPAVKIWHD